MTTADPNSAQPNRDTGTDQTDLRSPRGVRFSDSEWDLVKEAAVQHKTSAAEFVRNATLGAIDSAPGDGSDALSSAIVRLIKHTYRSVYILSTLKRDELVRDARDEELKNLIALARESENELMVRSPK